ncbi:hypothetical protein CHLRE_13g573900v5 [Chlamydomonas reinhardtii]|uniref:Uncharacterized protein n=1 Tax=Chlamydomonas reinhardtii TaxID=3055 RepID=A8HSY0_CHLRE|nr:uncharacterized protein CHLRE_13g573900v5 [Chlamydomonas reinhardtii]PNW73816.1 hypothetical protein CHLRE_13g573900v5 [Chlamydomonas reinhardtii]|eukprot:XP_001693504.1 predicted protein [Chlamydomonas reinhardtii]
MANTNVAYPVLGVYLLLVLGAGLLAAFVNRIHLRKGHGDKVREHFMAGKGLGTFVWFWTMMATLFSGYSVSGIVNEAYGTGWMATRWIPGGVGLYIAFAVMAPRIHAVAKRRGYFTMSQVLFDRFSGPSSCHWIIPHIIALLAFFCLQLPVFTYLITQFQSLGREVRTFTAGDISATTAICVAASVLLICDLLGGMRAVAFTDVLQGVVLFCGSIIFLVIQKTELGGFEDAHNYWGNPANVAKPRVWNMQHVPNEVNQVSYFDFVFKTTAAATMFPHLTARLFAAKDAKVIRKGMSMMVFTFFVVQFSSMITGWVAIAALPVLPKGSSAFGAMLLLVAQQGTGQAVVSALLLASAICAMMSTADSALLACSSMWVRDLYTKYFRPHASEMEQLIFGKVVAIIALAIGVLLGNLSIETGKPDLSGLFALQNVTPIHVVPAVWLGLHWRGLRGEAVLVGFVTGLGVTLGIVFSDKNISRSVGSDMTASGLSSAWIGFCINIALVISIGSLMQFFPRLFPWIKPLPPPAEEEETAPDSGDTDAASQDSQDAIAIAANEAAIAAAKGIEAPELPPVPVDAAGHHTIPAGHHAGEQYSAFVPRWLDIGTRRDKTLNPYFWTFMGIVLLFTVPFYRPPGSKDGYVGSIGAWPFTSLFLSGILAICGSVTFLYFWTDYRPIKESVAPGMLPPQEVVVAEPGAENGAAVSVVAAAAEPIKA